MAKRRMHLAALALTAASASANFVITSPVADQVCVGGIPCTVSWYDDGTLPAVASYGEVDISLYVGSGGQGVQVRHLQNVNVNELVQIDPVIDPAAGPDGSVLSFTRPVSVKLMRQAQLPRSFYFVRIQSLEDPTLSVDSQQITLAQMTGALSPEASAAVGDVAPASSTGAVEVSTSVVTQTMSTTQSPDVSSVSKTSSISSTTAQGLNTVVHDNVFGSGASPIVAPLYILGFTAITMFCMVL